MEKLREKGKDGEYVSDGTVRGLKTKNRGTASTLAFA